MKVITFDINKGIYHFELENFSTLLHAHPAAELILSRSGTFSIATTSSTYSNLSFALIDANVPHQLFSEKGAIQLLMLECPSRLLQEYLAPFSISLTAGIYTQKTKSAKSKLLDHLLQLATQNTIPKTEDQRIQTCLDFFLYESTDYPQMIQDLKEKVYLSESRLSHLFKQEIGISLKKYVVWSRLKKAFRMVLQENLNMYDAALQSGFYDQAHLSNAFKQLLGLRPSEVYNSRTLQE